MSAAIQRSACASGSSAGATGSNPFSKALSATSSGVSRAGRRWSEVMVRLCPESGRKYRTKYRSRRVSLAAMSPFAGTDTWPEKPYPDMAKRTNPK
jgi:hypothetical protein